MVEHRLTPRTPIGGCDFCGATTHPGGSVIALNGRNYDIACGEGEEARVIELAGEVRRRMEGLVKNSGPVAENLLFALTALLMSFLASAASMSLFKNRR